MRPSGCKLCRHSDITQVYEGLVRAGIYGKRSDEEYQVWRCQHCRVEFLHPFPTMDYAGDAYRREYNATTTVEGYAALHDPLQRRYAEFVSGRVNIHDCVIADIGCGGGTFLDLVAPMARRTVAVEPFEGYHTSLRARGHCVFPELADYLQESPSAGLDVAVSFHVIEHVPDPIQFLRSMHGALRSGGSAFLVTPNIDDVLKRLGCEPFRQFNYRTAHLWYFNETSLRWCARAAGFTDVSTAFDHTYDLSNALCWLAEGRPTGLGKLSFIEEDLDHRWAALLEQQGMADSVWLLLTK